MEELAPGYEGRQEFWKYARATSLEICPAEPHDRTCSQCGGDLIVGALFCHLCGAERDLARPFWSRLPSWRSSAAVCKALGQSAASLAALLLGSMFMLAALLTGFFFAAATVLDWQAVQLWRIQWLLAAIASFAAGILLRKARD